MPRVTRKLLFEKSIAIRKLPENIKPETQKIFDGALEYPIPAVYNCEIRNALVTVDGVVYTRGKMVIESLMRDSHKEWFHPAYYFLQRLLKKNKRLRSTSTIVHAYNYWGEGYFHWITDVLPRLYCIKDELPNAVVLLPEIWNGVYSTRTAIKMTVMPLKKKIKSPSMYEITLAPFRIGSFSFISGSSYITTKNLRMVTHAAPSGNYHVELMKSVRELYHDFYARGTDKEKYPERIYVSRTKAMRRKIMNEQEVIDVLTSKGFKILFFEELSFEEQVRHAFHCNILISLHGAGLTNILFMNSGSKVMEMSSVDPNKNLCYFSLANAVDVKYYYQFCKKEDESMNVQNANVYVDIEDLKSNVKLMLAE